ncbi:MAG: Fic family protein [Endomicrobia bacterium]|nr:Fic family protein [Endomicrobiia bacterium]
MRKEFIYQHSGWPDFTWDKEKILVLLSEVKQKKGLFLGKMTSLGLLLQEKANLSTITENIVKSSEIEGQILNVEAVRSSVAKRLGVELERSVAAGRDVDAIVSMMMDAIHNCNLPMTKERLFGWHNALFSSGYSGIFKIKVAAFREGEMQIVSGVIGKEKVHFTAPPPQTLNGEMDKFLEWLNNDNSCDLIIKAATAHLWFVTLHPFDDGNGRIARAITDMLLVKADNSEKRFYSMSAQIQKMKSGYYKILEQTQKGGLDISGWLEWFLNCLSDSIDFSEKLLSSVLKKHYFRQKAADLHLNPRQIKIVNMLFDGFKGSLTASKMAKITKTSHDTATRDIAELMACGILAKKGDGRSTQYVIKDDEKIT